MFNSYFYEYPAIEEFSDLVRNRNSDSSPVEEKILFAVFEFIK